MKTSEKNFLVGDVDVGICSPILYENIIAIVSMEVESKQPFLST